jgi:hypothetical protein
MADTETFDNTPPPKGDGLADGDNDNVTVFPAEQELYRVVVDRLGAALDDFRTVTDAATADRAEGLLRDGGLHKFDTYRHELWETVPKAQQADRKRQVTALGRAFKEELNQARVLRRKAGAEAGRERAVIPGIRPAEQEIVEDYAFDEVAGTWLRRRSMEHLKQHAFEQEWTERLMHALAFQKPNGEWAVRPLSAWFKEQKDAVVVEGLGVIPSAASDTVETVTIEGWPKRLLNAWHDPVPDVIAGIGAVSDRDVSPWLDLVTYVLKAPDPGDARVAPVLDWMAGVAAAPALKPGWAPYLSGDAGTGKNLMLTPLERALGPGLVRRISPAELRETFDEYRKARLCIIAEARETTPGTITPHDVYAKVKEIVDATANWTLVNPKFRPKQWIYSTTALAILTNQPNMLPVDPRERRLGFYRVEVPPRPREYFEGLVFWLNTGWSMSAHLHSSFAPGWKLVVAWLVQRWADMDDTRRTAFQGNAPETPEKQTMVAVAANPMKELLGAILAGDFKESQRYIPDITDVNRVRAGLREAADSGRHGADRNTKMPANAVLNDWLREFGGEKLNYDPVKNVHTQILVDFSRHYLWAVRNPKNYRGLRPGEIAHACKGQKNWPI